MCKSIFSAVLILSLQLFIGMSFSYGQTPEVSDYQTFSFGERGQIKMLYDRRQRPQSVYLNGKVYIVYNAGGEIGAPSPVKSRPMITSYNLKTRQFSYAFPIGDGSKDHHYGPVIWTDNDQYLHVLHGCHKTPGTHLMSRQPMNIGSSLNDWTETTEIAPSISYPTFYQIFDNKEMVYYRTVGHPSSWTYRISEDNGKSWQGPEVDVTDLDIKGRFQWSSYQTKLPSKDGRYLHVVFTAYDDNKANDPARFYNKRYKKAVSNEWKYNLYYIKVDLKTQEVTNSGGEKMSLPIDLDQANEKCRIWDTEGRGAGVPPDIVIDENGNPAFLHVLSEESTEIHNYYFVYLDKGKWKKTIVAPSNHQWNSSHISLDQRGEYHAYLIVGQSYLDTKWVEGKDAGSKFQKGEIDYSKAGGFMDKHGGGGIEEWISTDKGMTWEKFRDLTPDQSKYPNWKFNNIQPVTRADGSAVDGMLLFYGWKDKYVSDAKAFLLHQIESSTVETQN